MVARKSKLRKKRGNGQGSSIPVFIHSLWRSGSTSNRLAAGKSYLSFYLLWCLGLLEGLVNADSLPNIDALSGSQSYQAEINKHFFHFNIMDLDFSDCNLPQRYYTDADKAFFALLEDRVHSLLLMSGNFQEQLLTCRG